MAALELPLHAFAEPGLDNGLRQPLVKCQQYEVTGSTLFGPASDNASFLIWSPETPRLTIIDTTVTGRTSYIDGIFRSVVGVDSQSFPILLLSKSADSYAVTGISEKTGLPLWRKDLGNLRFLHSPKRIDGSSHSLPETTSEVLALREDGMVIAIDRRTGGIREIRGTDVGNREQILRIGEHLVTHRDGNFVSVSLKNGTRKNSGKLSVGLIQMFAIDDSRFAAANSRGDIIVGRIGVTRNLWSVRVGGGVLSMYKFGNYLVLPSLDNYIYAYDVRNGVLKWKTRLKGRPRGFSVANGYAAVTTAGESSLSILDLRNGATVNELDLDESGNRVLSFALTSDEVVLLRASTIEVYRARCSV